MSSDCREAFVCYSLFIGSGRGIKCDENHIVKMDFYKITWECSAQGWVATSSAVPRRRLFPHRPRPKWMS